MLLTLALTTGIHIAPCAASWQDVSHPRQCDSFLSPRIFCCRPASHTPQPSPRAGPIASAFLLTRWGYAVSYVGSVTLATIPGRQGLSWPACSFCLNSQKTLKASLALAMAIGEHPVGSWGLGYLCLSHLFVGFGMGSGVPWGSQKAPRESCLCNLWGFFWRFPLPAPCQIWQKRCIEHSLGPSADSASYQLCNFGLLTASPSLSFLTGNWQGVEEVENYFIELSSFSETACEELSSKHTQKCRGYYLRKYPVVFITQSTGSKTFLALWEAKRCNDSQSEA